MSTTLHWVIQQQHQQRQNCWVKQPSLFCRRVGDEVKKFYEIDGWQRRLAPDTGNAENRRRSTGN
jgi:hypothetical protein